VVTPILVNPSAPFGSKADVDVSRPDMRGYPVPGARVSLRFYAASVRRARLRPALFAWVC